MLSSTLGVAVLAVLANAQPQSITITPFLTSSTSSSAPTVTPAGRLELVSTGNTSAAAAQTHTVAVGASGFSFSPAKTEANVGDTIEWIFYPDAHSVIRAEFGFPCTPYEYIDIGREGFYSGNQSVKAITNDMPRYRVLVNDTLPIFYYCGAPGSCYKEKMIGVINENSTQTLDKQLEAALPLTTQILPGEPFPTESDAPKATNGGSSSSDNSAVINNYHHSVTGGQIAGIIIGSLAFLLLGGLLVYLCGRRGGINRAYRRTSTAYRVPYPPSSQPTITEINYSMQPKSPATQGWRSSHYSAFSGPYRDHATPTAQFSPQLSPQPTGFPHPVNGMQTYFDPRISSVAPSDVAEAPDNQAPPPVAAPAAPAAAPVELPTATDSGNSPPPRYMPRFSFAGQESDYRPSRKE
ncbi:extracellular serine-rich protein [Colletotrichum orchidophilum]|uniref:Extracellular serine-rich protein n=1 Tax=Colletotrichum orchidophilum TaxID=1209926 RepID=A0A1G4B6I2_9PEZI|nr:extracellular serine-rich protein [Colletotrichum orchidophilum]OHE96936.1 extracellular serine-rich protein [Colletotrichum orchidophilum]